ERMMAVAATLFNRANDTALPEDGYHVVYAELPLSPEEQSARRQHVTAARAAGLLSRPTAHMTLNPGVTEEQAQRDLEAIDEESRALEPEAQPEEAANRPAEEPAPQAEQAREPAAEETEGLNGAQIREAVAIVERLTYGEMERTVGEILLMELGMDPANASRLVSSITPRPRPTAPVVEPVAPPPGGTDEEEDPNG